MKKLILNGLIACSAIAFNGISQTTVDFGYTGTPQNWVVPPCVSSVDASIGGGQGGGPCPNSGALINVNIPLNPGDVLTMDIGGSANGIQGGYSAYGSGGNGFASSNGNATYNSYGGGGATAIYINGVLYMVVGGGGGMGGGSVTNNCGGAGGCANGVQGGNTYGQGGSPGTQFAPGAGGTPWAGTPPGGSPGVGSNGGNGGFWQTASGGGGGGGYYGGGGGGNDGCCTGANGGGGGGSGSSLIPAGANCINGGNPGPGNASFTFIGGITAGATNTGPYCAGDMVQLDGTGGQEYNWTGPNGFTSTLQNPTIPASVVANSGVYTLIVTDTTNCGGSDTTTTTVLVKPMPTVDPVSDQSICNGSSTTAVNFTGIEPGTTYSWANDNTSTSLAATGTGNIAAFMGTAVTGTEVSNITVTPSLNGCVGTPEMFSITVLLDPSLTVSNDTLICENGTAYLVATASGGGGGPYLYHWDQTTSTLGNQSEGPASATTYTVYGESANGCLTAPLEIDVTVRPPLTGTISPIDTVCPTYSTDLMATVVGGLGVPYTFVWSSTDTQTGPANHTITVAPSVSTNYSVTVTDGCESTPLVMSTNVRVSPLPVPQFEVLNPEQCEPAIFDVVNTTDSTLSQYVYWLVDDQFQYLNQDTIITPELWAGDYNIQMIVTSYEGCVDSTTFVNALYVQPMPKADFRYSPNPVTMFNTNVGFANYSINGFSYQWYFEDGYPDESTQKNVDVQFEDGVTGTYEIMLITTSELGCIDTMIEQLVVYPEVIIYAPNSFTPDNDEHNQDWKIYMEGIDVYDFELLIFNRWGEVVWESHDITIAWDGTFRGKAIPPGSYTWIVRTKDILNDKKYTYNGHVNVLR